MNNNFRNPPKGFTAPPPNPSKIFNIVSITFNDQLCFRYIQNVYGHFVIGATAQAGQRNVVLLHIVPVTDGYNQNGDTEVYILFSFVFFFKFKYHSKKILYHPKPSATMSCRFNDMVLELIHCSEL